MMMFQQKGGSYELIVDPCTLMEREALEVVSSRKGGPGEPFVDPPLGLQERLRLHCCFVVVVFLFVFVSQC